MFEGLTSDAALISSLVTVFLALFVAIWVSYKEKERKSRR